ncbi:hypothetical protein OSB04_006767 [Centaurea solstitialis]|uniref:Uncharacterized protein n=1 Tax=Centaurea solstitialis TaxID=347529 RepID=A0AA38WHT5_9ASTR|nr:hypothetical protein OSB04_006767 [Centaurea solstitialis]
MKSRNLDFHCEKSPRKRTGGRVSDPIESASRVFMMMLIVDLKPQKYDPRNYKLTQLTNISNTYLWRSYKQETHRTTPERRTSRPFNKDNERANELLGIIHTDVCGPFSHEARGGYRFFITFTDDFSRYGYVYLIRHKSEAFERFKEFQNEVQNQLDR